MGYSFDKGSHWRPVGPDRDPIPSWQLEAYGFVSPLRESLEMGTDIDESLIGPMCNWYVFGV